MDNDVFDILISGIMLLLALGLVVLWKHIEGLHDKLIRILCLVKKNNGIESNIFYLIKDLDCRVCKLEDNRETN